MSNNFLKKVENFVCENCGFEIEGDGFTNHCPKCLFSKHVDINPGDRQEECQGLMEPVSIEKKGDKYIILHRCKKCGFERKNKIQDEDDFEEILRLIRLTS